MVPSSYDCYEEQTNMTLKAVPDIWEALYKLFNKNIMYYNESSFHKYIH